MNILNPDLQDLLIERIVGFAKCGIFDGVELDCFLHHGVGCVGAPGEPEEAIIAAYTRILREVRARAKDDFLIILNGNHTKLRHYAEFINGSAMEYGKDSLGSGEETYKRLQLFDEVLTWNEENFREPVVNWAHGPLYPSEPLTALITNVACVYSRREVSRFLMATFVWNMYRIIGKDGMTKHTMTGMPFGIPTSGNPSERRGNCMKIEKVFLSVSSPTDGQFTIVVGKHKRFNSRCDPPVSQVVSQAQHTLFPI